MTDCLRLSIEVSQKIYRVLPSFPVFSQDLPGFTGFYRFFIVVLVGLAESFTDCDLPWEVGIVQLIWTTSTLVFACFLITFLVERLLFVSTGIENNAGRLFTEFPPR